MHLLSRLKEEFSFLRGNTLVMMTSWLLLNFAGAIPATYYSLFILELGGVPFIIGVLESVSFLVMALVQFPGGYIADKYGRRWLIVTFTSGLAISNLLYVFALSWHFILVGVILQNLFLVYQPAMFAMIADSMPAERRGIGFSSFMFVNNVASVFSPAIAGILYAQYGLVSGMRMAYAAVVAFYFVAAVVRTKLTETLRADNERISLSGAVSEYPKAVKEGLQVWKALPPSMFFLFLTNALSSFAFTMSYPYLMVYAIQVLGINPLDWAIIMMWFTGSMILSALPSGKLADKIGRKKPLLASWILLALFPLLFLCGKENTAAVVAAFLFFGVSNALFVAAYQALEADLVPKELRGKEMGCSQFVTYLLMGIGGLIGGFVYQYVSQTLPFILAFIVTIPCIFVTLFLIYEPEKRQL